MMYLKLFTEGKIEEKCEGTMEEARITSVRIC